MSGSARTAPTATGGLATLLGEEEQIKDVAEGRPHGHQDRHPARPSWGRGAAADPGPLLCRALRGRDGGPSPCGSTDPPPGIELQVDFGRLGLVPDGERRRVCQGLIFTACFSRHQFVWPTFSPDHRGGHQGLRGGLELLRCGVPRRHPRQHEVDRHRGRATPRPGSTTPSSNTPSPEASSSTPPGWPTPTDKPRVESVVHYVQHNFFAGETFIDLADCRVRAETWCSVTAGMRIHGTTQCRPIEAFRTEELPLLLPRPGAPFDTPRWSDPKVHRDFHVEVDKAIYSVSHHLVGRTLRARLDSTTVKLYLKGELVKVHPRKPQAARITDPADMPKGTEIYATRDIARFGAMAADHGPGHRPLRHRHPGHAAALDQDAPGLSPARLWSRSGAPSGSTLACRSGPRGRSGRRESGLAHARTGPGGRRTWRACHDPVVIQGRFARDPSEFASVTETGR